MNLTKEQISSIKLMASMLAPWTTQRGVCPVCNGGSTNEKSFSLTVEPAQIKFMCFRNACGARGILGERNVNVNAKLKTSGIRMFEGEKEPLPEYVRTWLAKVLGVTDHHIRKLSATWHVSDTHYIYSTTILPLGRVVYPVRDYAGKHKGYILRSYDPGVKPKALTYRETESDTFLAWFMSDDPESQKLVIVEDIVSAVRASKFCNAVALLGTHMSMCDVVEITRFCKTASITDVRLALDEDAFRTALDHAKRYKLRLPMTVCKLDADFKDSTDETIERVLS